MKTLAALDLDNFPDSPYASELRRDFPDLRFSAELEREFQAFHLDRVRARARFFQLAVCLLAAAVAVRLVLLDRLPAHSVLVGWLGIVILTCLVLAWASWSSWYERLYLPAARIGLPLLSIASRALARSWTIQLVSIPDGRARMVSSTPGPPRSG